MNNCFTFISLAYTPLFLCAIVLNTKVSL